MAEQSNVISKFVKMTINTEGRDFAVGDIHGNYSALEELLKLVNFDPTKDRLFSVGDLVDRGRENYRVLEFLSYPWFYAILGNHEKMIINIGLKSYAEAYPPNKVNKAGNQWFFKLSDEDRIKHIEAFKNLPIAMQLGNIGLVHAQPLGSWRATINAIKKNRTKLIDNLYWSRVHAKKVAKNKKIPVTSGIKHVVVGHSIFEDPIYSGNTYFLDTGYFYANGSLSLLNLKTMNIEARVYNQ